MSKKNEPKSSNEFGGGLVVDSALEAGGACEIPDPSPELLENPAPSTQQGPEVGLQPVDEVVLVAMPEGKLEPGGGKDGVVPDATEPNPDDLVSQPAATTPHEPDGQSPHADASAAWDTTALLRGLGQGSKAKATPAKKKEGNNNKKGRGASDSQKPAVAETSQQRGNTSQRRASRRDSASKSQPTAGGGQSKPPGGDRRDQTSRREYSTVLEDLARERDERLRRGPSEVRPPSPEAQMKRGVRNRDEDEETDSPKPRAPPTPEGTTAKDQAMALALYPDPMHRREGEATPLLSRIPDATERAFARYAMGDPMAMRPSDSNLISHHHQLLQHERQQAQALERIAQSQIDSRIRELQALLAAEQAKKKELRQWSANHPKHLADWSKGALHLLQAHMGMLESILADSATTFLVRYAPVETNLSPAESGNQLVCHICNSYLWPWEVRKHMTKHDRLRPLPDVRNHDGVSCSAVAALELLAPVLHSPWAGFLTRQAYRAPRSSDATAAQKTATTRLSKLGGKSITSVISRLVCDNPFTLASMLPQWTYTTTCARCQAVFTHPAVAPVPAIRLNEPISVTLPATALPFAFSACTTCAGTGPLFQEVRLEKSLSKYALVMAETRAPTPNGPQQADIIAGKDIVGLETIWESEVSMTSVVLHIPPCTLYPEGHFETVFNDGAQYVVLSDAADDSRLRQFEPPSAQATYLSGPDELQDYLKDMKKKFSAQPLFALYEVTKWKPPRRTEIPAPVAGARYATQPEPRFTRRATAEEAAKSLGAENELERKMPLCSTGLLSDWEGGERNFSAFTPYLNEGPEDRPTLNDDYQAALVESISSRTRPAHVRLEDFNLARFRQQSASVATAKSKYAEGAIMIGSIMDPPRCAWVPWFKWFQGVYAPGAATAEVTHFSFREAPMQTGPHLLPLKLRDGQRYPGTTISNWKDASTILGLGRARLASWNMQGQAHTKVTQKAEIIVTAFTDGKVDALFLQEAHGKLSPTLANLVKKALDKQGLGPITILEEPRTNKSLGKGGGLVAIVKSRFKPIIFDPGGGRPPDLHAAIEYMPVRLTLSEEGDPEVALHVSNTYITNTDKSIKGLLGAGVLSHFTPNFDVILGDLNARHRDWGSVETLQQHSGNAILQRGIKVHQELAADAWSVAHIDDRKVVSTRYGTTVDLIAHSPSTTLAGAGRLNCCDRAVQQELSDHYLLYADLGPDIVLPKWRNTTAPPGFKFVSWSKVTSAQWDKFAADVDAELKQVRPNCSMTMRHHMFVKAVLKASACFPRGRRESPTLFSSTAIQDAIRRKKWAQLNELIEKEAMRFLKGGSKNCHSAYKVLTEEPSVPCDIDPDTMAKFYSGDGPPDPPPHQRKEFYPDDAEEAKPAQELPHIKGEAAPHCTYVELQFCLRRNRKGGCVDADGIHANHLHHLGPGAKLYLRQWFTEILRRRVIPSPWKKQVTVPAYKGKGKPTNHPKSMRPIAITSLLSRTFERIVVRRLRPHFKLSSRQHAYRRKRGCTTAMAACLQSLGNAASRSRTYKSETGTKRMRHQTALVSVDFTNAFGEVRRQKLYDALLAKNIPHCYVDLLDDFMHRRTLRVRTHKGYSQPVAARGSPQGSLFGCYAWDVYADLCLRRLEGLRERQLESLRDTWKITGKGKRPPPANAGTIDFVAYSDDLQLWASAAPIPGKDPPLAHYLQEMCDEVAGWAREMGVPISFDKTRVIDFQPSHGADPDRIQDLRQSLAALTMEDLSGNRHNLVLAGTDETVKILGVLVDRHLLFHEHVEDVRKRAMDVLSFIRRLPYIPQAWRRELWLSYGASIMRHAAPAWWPRTSPTTRKRLTVLHNSAARVALSVQDNTPTSVALAECDLLPLDLIICKDISKLVQEIRCFKDDTFSAFRELVVTDSSYKLHNASTLRDAAVLSGAAPEWDCSSTAAAGAAAASPPAFYGVLADEDELTPDELAACEHITVLIEPGIPGTRKGSADEQTPEKVQQLLASNITRLNGLGPGLRCYTDGAYHPASGDEPPLSALAAVFYECSDVSPDPDGEDTMTAHLGGGSTVTEEWQEVELDSYRRSSPGPSTACSFTVEFMATLELAVEGVWDILQTLPQDHPLRQRPIQFLSDSKSYYSELNKLAPGQTSVQGFLGWRKLAWLQRVSGQEITLAWIFSHALTRGNDNVDACATRALGTARAPGVPPPNEWVGDLARQQWLPPVTEYYDNLLANNDPLTTERFRYRHCPKGVKRTRLSLFSRPHHLGQAKLLSQARVGVAADLGGHLIGVPDKCPLCDMAISRVKDTAVEHVFLCNYPEAVDARLSHCDNEGNPAESRHLWSSPTTAAKYLCAFRDLRRDALRPQDPHTAAASVEPEQSDDDDE